MEEEVNGSSELRPAKTEETVSHRQSNDVKEVGTSPVQSNLCTSCTMPHTNHTKTCECVSERNIVTMDECF